ncbi:MAG TPA: hypothetical protein VHP54_01670 [Caproiciproducens sp.]|nr:hypothetical protein [Caproiciproducens sp.]
MTDKKLNAVIILITCGIVAALGFGIYKINAENSYDKNRIGIDLPKQSIILKQEDDHGGFHGDGEYYSEIQLTADGVKEFMDKAGKTGKWHSLPLPKDIDLIIHGNEFRSVGTMSKMIPKNIKNGIYYARDRLAEQDPSEKDTSILSRYSYNVTISILDFDTRKLYIYELDT